MFESTSVHLAEGMTQGVEYPGLGGFVWTLREEGGGARSGCVREYPECNRDRHQSCNENIDGPQKVYEANEEEYQSKLEQEGEERDNFGDTPDFQSYLAVLPDANQFTWCGVADTKVISKPLFCEHTERTHDETDDETAKPEHIDANYRCRGSKGNLGKWCLSLVGRYRSVGCRY